jgi:hypothetical protein
MTDEDLPIRPSPTQTSDKDVLGDAPETTSDDRLPTRKREFGIIPIPKSRRLDPNRKVHEQLVFTWKMNLILAGAAVSLSCLIISRKAD